MTMLFLLLTTLSTPSLADRRCPTLPTFPEDGETDVPTNLARFYFDSPGPVDGFPYGGICDPYEVIVVSEDGVVVSGQKSSAYVELSGLEANTTYTATVSTEREVTATSVFTTGAGPAAPYTVTPTSMRATATSSSHGNVCGTVDLEIDALDAYSIVMVSVSSPPPWRRSTGGPQQMTVTASESPGEIYVAEGSDGQRCFLVTSVSVDGVETSISVCGDVVSPDYQTCNFGPPPIPTPVCSSASVRPLSFLALTALIVAAVRRRRRL